MAYSASTLSSTFATPSVLFSWAFISSARISARRGGGGSCLYVIVRHFHVLCFKSILPLEVDWSITVNESISQRISKSIQSTVNTDFCPMCMHGPDSAEPYVIGHASGIQISSNILLFYIYTLQLDGHKEFQFKQTPGHQWSHGPESELLQSAVILD